MGAPDAQILKFSQRNETRFIWKVFEQLQNGILFNCETILRGLRAVDSTAPQIGSEIGDFVKFRQFYDIWDVPLPPICNYTLFLFYYIVYSSNIYS